MGHSATAKATAGQVGGAGEAALAFFEKISLIFWAVQATVFE
jgi:hypothetical protein